MNAHEVIESYVRDVAACLPRKRRNDVALELRSLLGDELSARAEQDGRAPDKAMALDVLKAFGRPEEVARRYHERPPIIDPADTHHFIIWTVAGVVTLAVLSLLDREATLDDSLFLQWLGVLVIFFALAGWWRRRAPGQLGWTPKADPDAAPRLAALFAALGTLIFPVFMYAAPVTFAETLFLGQIATSGLELAPAFAASWQRVATLAMLGLIVLIYLVVVIAGRWTPRARWTSVAAHVVLGLLLLAHGTPMTGSDGATFEVFVGDQANAVAAAVFPLVAALLLLTGLYAAWQEWSRVRPAAAREAIV